MKRCIFIYLTFWSVSGFSQIKDVEHHNQFWNQYTFLGRVSDRWSLYFDYVDRFNQFYKSQNTIFFRPAIAFDLSESAGVYAGYCYAETFPDEHTPVKLKEHRPWQQLLIHNKLGKFSFQHRYRLEERFNEVYKGTVLPGYVFTFRFRYKLNVQYPIWKIKDGVTSLSVLFTDELITSFGKNVEVSYFNQNRAFLGLSLQMSKSLSASVGYTNIFRSTTTPLHYLDIDAPTININQKIDLRKKARPGKA
jgi:hypothetical protein